jgi:hypothetical protein
MRVDNSTHSGWTDPKLLVTSSYGKSSGCYLNPSLLLQLAGKLMMYRRPDGLRKHVGAELRNWRYVHSFL